MKIWLRPAAERDIAEAIEWYDQQQSGLGDEFLARVEAVFARIAERPNGFPSTHAIFKRALIGRFPYTVYFRIEGGSIVVFAVYHQRRNPVVLAQRLDPS